MRIFMTDETVEITDFNGFPMRSEIEIIRNK